MNLTTYAINDCSGTYFKFVFANGFIVSFILHVLLGIIISILAILFNSVVTIICIRKKFDQESMQFLILNSSLFDIISAVAMLAGYIPTSILSLYHLHSCFLFRAFSSVGFLCSSINITTITLLAIDRYICICHTLRFPNFTSQSKIYYRRIVLTVGIITVVIFTIDFLTANTTVYPISIAINFCVAISISLFTFLKIFIEHKRICRIMPIQTPGQIQEAEQKAKKVKLARVTFIVVLTSVICYGTAIATGIIWLTYQTSAPDSFWLLVEWCYVFYISKSVINPWVFYLSVRDIKKRVRKMFKRSVTES